MPHALILGGTGVIGRATSLRLLAAGWQVDVTGRNPANMPSEVAAAGGRFIKQTAPTRFSFALLSATVRTC